jgi:hypothetical protein
LIGVDGAVLGELPTRHQYELQLFADGLAARFAEDAP